MYRVTGLDGSHYIAQDLNVLQQWVNEGRVTPQMFVEDMSRATSAPAGSMHGLIWPYQQTATAIDPRNIPRTPLGNATAYPRGYGQEVPSPMVKAILATVLSVFGCCLPIGVVAIIYAAQVNSSNRVGDHMGAMAAAKNANMWANISIGLSVVLIALRLMGGFLTGF